MTTHTVPANTVLTKENSMQLKTTMSAAFYDPLAHIQEILPSEMLRERVVSRLAWHIDVLTVNQLRSCYFDLRDEFDAMEDLPPTIDKYNDFISLMKSKDDAHTAMAELGLTQSSGAVTLRQLLLLRPQFHDAVVQANFAKTGTINPKMNRRSRKDEEPYRMLSVEELLHAEKAQQVGGSQAVKLRIDAKRAAAGDTVKEERLYQSAVEREQMFFDDQHGRRKNNIDTLVHMLDFIRYTGTEDHAEFHELPIDVQRTLIESIFAGIDQGMSNANRNRHVSTQDYWSLGEERDAAVAAIKAILAQPKFNSPEPSPVRSEADATQVRIDHARIEEKRRRYLDENVFGAAKKADVKA